MKGMIDLGYETFTATPHVMEDMWRNNTETISEGFAVLKKAMDDEGINNEVRMAAEYLVDGNFTQLLEEKAALLTIHDNKVLIEISFIEPPRNLKEIICEMYCNAPNGWPKKEWLIFWVQTFITIDIWMP